MDTKKPRSPKIAQMVWGRMTVDNVGSGKDFKLWPGGGRPWDWKETGTRHVPGIQPDDVAELLAHGARVVVLSRGMWKALRTRRDTLELLEARGVTVHVAETSEAARIYNDLVEQGAAVGGLFHSTC